MHAKILAAVLSSVLLGYAAQAQAVCSAIPNFPNYFQFAPGPNPAGVTITNTDSSGNACNGITFDNFGTLNNSLGATLENIDTLNNYGALNNYGTLGTSFSRGTLNNNGLLKNYGSLRTHDLTNNISGTLFNYGDLIVQANPSYVSNSGMLNNYGFLFLGRFGLVNTGTLDNHGGVQINETLDNYGVVNNHAGASMLVNIGGISNHGTLNNYGNVNNIGGLHNSGTLNNYGTYSVRTQVPSDNSGTLNNFGSLWFKLENLSASSPPQSPASNTGTLNNSGTLTNDIQIINSGQFLNSGSVIGTGTYTQTAGTTVVNGTMTQAAVNISGGVLSGSGSITGPVTIDGGTLAVGNSPGAMSIIGDYTQTMLGSFEAEIGGLVQGITYDYLNVSGTATLDGLLNVSLYDFGTGLFSPKLGDTFDILSADTILGAFSAFSFAQLGLDLEWQVSYLSDLYGTTDVVRLHVAAVPEPEIYAMMGVGLGVLGWVARRKKKQAATV